jgi:hypothetical protein
MSVVRSISLIFAVASCGSLLACGPVHSVTVGRGGPPPDGPPVVVREGGAHAPPPWAPAHGHRRHHQRAYQHRDATVDLVFDSGLGVYVVVGLPNYYYWNGLYLRLDAGRWVQAPYIDARWAPCPADRIPGGLRARAEESGRGNDDDQGNGHGHGRGAAKRDDD